MLSTDHPLILEVFLFDRFTITEKLYNIYNALRQRRRRENYEYKNIAF